MTLDDARFEQIASHHQSCAGLCETNTVVAALRASREQQRRYEDWLRRLCYMPNGVERHGDKTMGSCAIYTNDKCDCLYGAARAALGEEAPHVA